MTKQNLPRIALRVERESGEHEELSFCWPIEIVPATETLWRMRDANGAEYYFTESGYYDGCGAVVSEDDTELMNALTDVLRGRVKSDEEVRRA